MNDVDKANLSNIFKYAIIHFSGNTDEVLKIIQFKERIIHSIETSEKMLEEINLIRAEIEELKNKEINKLPSVKG